VQIGSWAKRLLVVLVVAPVLAAALSIGASLVPDRAILGELTEAVERSEIIPIPQVGISGRALDTFSDCIALTVGLGDTDGGLTTIWLRSPTLGSCDGAIASLRAYEAGEGLSGGYEYFRYWHGYTVVSRPLVATVGVSGQRIALLWALIGALFLLARRLWQRHGPLAAIALIGPFLLTTDTIELARSLPHGVPALVAVAGAWWLHRISGPPPSPSDRTADGRSDLSVATAAFVVGATYVFVDLLTTPPGAWALATGVVALSSAQHLSGRALARRTVLTAGAWVTGWVWTWVSKWAMAAAVRGFAAVNNNVSGAIQERIGGERDFIELKLFNPIQTNVAKWLEHPLTPPVLLAIVIAVVVVARRQEFAQTWSTRLVIAAPALLSLIHISEPTRPY